MAAPVPPRTQILNNLAQEPPLVASYNITSQIEPVAWCTTNGFAVDYPSGRNTLLVNTFQNGQNPAGGSYNISFTADNCECYRGLKDFGDLLADIGDPNAASILQHAKNIGIAVHGLYDVVRRKWVWNDTLKSGGGFIVWFDTIRILGRQKPKT